MSDVASPQLSKELFEISGWEMPHKDQLYFWHYKGAEPQFPKYTAGYLLRRLPALNAQGYVELTKMKDDYMAVYTINGRTHIFDPVRANTPEDALASLAITLINQGILPGRSEK